MSNQAANPTQCRLCGSKSGLLTLEHVPPKSTGNRGRVQIEHIRLSETGGTVRELSDGLALRVLCARCNNQTGSRLGTGFSDFARQVQQSGRIVAPKGGVFVSAVEVFPARILRQLLLCFLCAQPDDEREGWQAIRDFIRSRTAKVPNEAPRVSLYFNPSSTYKIAPVCSVGSIDGSGRSWVGSEIAAPGLGVLFSLGNTESAIQPLIGVEPVDVTLWGGAPFDQRESLTLKLPPLRVEEPHPLGYGRKKDFARWQTRNMIAWLVAQSKYPDSLTATAVMWRTHPC